MMEIVKQIIKKIPSLLWAARFYALSVLAAFAIFYLGLFLAFRNSGEKVREALADSVGGEVSVESSTFRADLMVEMRGIKVWAPGESSSRGDAPTLAIDSAVMRPSFTKLLRGKVKIRNVALINPALDIHKTRGGAYNTEAWVKKSYSCDLAPTLDKLPARVTLQGGAVKLTSGGVTLRAEGIGGEMGLARDGHVGARINGTFLGSAFDITGGMRPCSFESLSFKVVSDNFDFSGVWKKVAAMTTGSDAAARRVELGTGLLEIEIGGGADSPRVTGRASLRDFSASFSVSPPFLSLSEVRAGIGDTGVTGAGEIDFSSPDLKYSMEFSARGLDFARLMAPATGAKYSPEGTLRGTWRMTGSLAGVDKPAIRGDITVDNGSLRIPVPVLSTGASSTPDVLRLPFNTLTAHAEFDDDAVRFSGVSINGRGYSLNGDAVIHGAEDPLGGFREGFEYALDLSIDVESAEEMLGGARGFAGMLSGKLMGSVNMQGDLRRAGSARGSLSMRAANGELLNPYVPAGSPGSVVPFQQLETTIVVRDGAFKLSGSLLDKGLDANWGGFVTTTGEISLTGQAVVDTSKVEGMNLVARNIASGAVVPVAKFKSGLRVTGTLHNPESNWSAPTVTSIRLNTPSTTTFIEQPVTGVVNETTMTVDSQPDAATGSFSLP